MIALHAPLLFDGDELHHDRLVLIDGGEISDVVAADAKPPRAKLEHLAPGTLLAPGFVDLQVNGGGGVMFNDETSVEGLRTIAVAHARCGTTAILPTLISGTRPLLRKAIDAAHEAIARKVPGIVGLHLEGPFIAPARRGIHPEAAMTLPTEDDLHMLCAPFPGALLVTLAPDRVGAEEIGRLVKAGVIVFAGHTNATYEQVIAGIVAGISGFTHLFNAMSPMESRAPGAIGAALRRTSSKAGIIIDGHHVHPATVAVAYAAKGPDAMFLVSDAMATAGSDADGFVLNGERIRLIDGRLTNAAGTLAGAHLTMAEALRNAVEMVGIPIGEALRMATSGPADAASLRHHGRIRPGAAADLVALDEALNVTAVWQGGRRV